jgi:hypothetical protein
MKMYVAIMLHREHWSEKPTDQVSFGRLLSQMLKTSSGDALDASSLASKFMFQPTI